MSIHFDCGSCGKYITVCSCVLDIIFLGQYGHLLRKLYPFITNDGSYSYWIINYELSMLF